jgi:glycosyltransferase involved in cell wall biosynthesis
MCVHNGEEFLREAVQSILDQTYTDFEFIIINDASSDQTTSILLSYNDPRIKIVDNETNIGLTRSLNKGLRLATGEFVARMDADDISYPGRFAKQVEFLDRNRDITLCGTWVEFNGIKSAEPGYPVGTEEIKVASLSFNPFAHPTVMWRRRVFEELDLRYDESFRTSQDYELWSRVVYSVRTANIPMPLLNYRLHTNQVSRSKEENQKQNSRRIKLSQLNYLHLQPTGAEECAHLCIFDGQFDRYRGPAAIKAADEWMYRIVQANRTLAVFDEELLLKEWQSRFFGSYLYEYSFAIWKVIRRSWCMKICRVTPREKLRLAVKCLIRHKVKGEVTP